MGGIDGFSAWSPRSQSCRESRKEGPASVARGGNPAINVRSREQTAKNYFCTEPGDEGEGLDGKILKGSKDRNDLF